MKSIIRICIFCCFFSLPIVSFAQEALLSTVTSYTNAKAFGFPSTGSITKNNASFDYFNTTLLQNSSHRKNNNKQGIALRNIGMGFTITSIIGVISGGALIGTGVYLWTTGLAPTGYALSVSGYALSGVTGALFIPGVIMWPIGASMIN